MNAFHGNSPRRRLVAAAISVGLLLPAIAVAQAPAPAPTPAAPPSATAPVTPAPQAVPPAMTPAPQAPAAATAPTTPSTTEPSPAAAPTEPAASPSSPTAAAPAGGAPGADAPAAAPATPPTPDVTFKLPHDLSPWGMFMNADIVVKAVMVGLAFASVLSWTIWLAKGIELMMARTRMRRAIIALNQARSWSEATQRLQGSTSGAGALVAAADTELKLSADALSPDGVKERIASRLERLEAAAGRNMIRGTGILATIGATAPFIGLFGTVWGIMNSFIGISKSHTTNLAVVAPGIAEALLATALGLVAAIPAVVMYNMFSRWTAGYRAQTADASAEVLRLVSRDLDRGAFHRTADRRRSVAAE
jgi:biopolymer transport protein ExbB